MYGLLVVSYGKTSMIKDTKCLVWKRDRISRKPIESWIIVVRHFWRGRAFQTRQFLIDFIDFRIAQAFWITLVGCKIANQANSDLVLALFGHQFLNKSLVEHLRWLRCVAHLSSTKPCGFIWIAWASPAWFASDFIWPKLFVAPLWSVSVPSQPMDLPASLDAQSWRNRLWKIVRQQMHRSGVWKSTALPVWRACRQWQRGGREHSGAEEKEGAHANQCKIF